MSEPWLRHDNWSEEMQFNRNMGADNASSPGLALVAAAAASANGSTIANGRSLFPTFSFGEHRDGRLGMFNAEHRLGYSSLDTSLPHMLDQYAAIYNKNGRIGIYTREVGRHPVHFHDYYSVYNHRIEFPSYSNNTIPCYVGEERDHPQVQGEAQEARVEEEDQILLPQKSRRPPGARQGPLRQVCRFQGNTWQHSV